MARIEWLAERLETTDLDDLRKVDLKRLGLDPSDEEKLSALPLSPIWLEKWNAFIGRKEPDDELWYFETPPETPFLSTVAGYAIVRDGKIVESLTTRRS